MRGRLFGIDVGLWLFLLITIGCMQKSQQGGRIYRSKGHAAVTPTHRLDWWGSRHQQVLQRIGQGRVNLIFVGDSITQGWEAAGEEIWKEYYGHRHAANMGFAGDQTQHVLWRFDHGEIDGISPKVAVVLIGINNIGSDPSEEIADGIKAVCMDLQLKLPKTKILLLGVFPYQENPGDVRDKIIRVNDSIAQIADGEVIHYLDFGDKFLRPDKTMSADIMPDFLHPSARGYQIWAEAMEPKLAQLLGE